MMKSIFLSAMVCALSLFAGNKADAQTTITSFSPASAAPGATVTITGTGFSTTLSDNKVWLGGTNCAVTTATATQLEVTIPGNAEAYEQFLYTNTATNRSCYSMNKFVMRYVNAYGYTYSACSFSVPVKFTIGTSGGTYVGQTVPIADINEDGKTDILMNTGSGLDILYNQSVSGSLNASSFSRTSVTTNISSNVNATSTHLADLNSDGKLDFLLAVSGSSNSGSININTSSSPSSFSVGSRIILSSAYYDGVNMTDIDLDGRIDYFSAYSTLSYLQLGLNASSSGTFNMTHGAQFPFPSSSDRRAVRKGDFNFDGKEDFVIGSSSGITGKVEVYRNTTNGAAAAISNFSFTADAIPVSLSYYTSSIQSADFDGDSKLDIVMAYGGYSGGFSNTNKVSVFQNTTVNSGDAISFGTKSDISFTGYTATQGIGIADMNNDGLPDLIVSGNQNIGLYYVENTSGAGVISFASPVLISATSSDNLDLYTLRIFDIDGDGLQDIVGIKKGGGAGSVVVYRNLPGNAVTIGSAQYKTLGAAFAAINSGTHTGAINIEMSSSTRECSTATLNASGTGSASYTSVNIYPTTANLTISGDVAGVLIDLNGADNVTIDGRVNAAGSTKSLVIENLNTGSTAATVRLTGSAENNNLKYLTLKGSGSGTALGIVYLATASGGNGNSGNIVEYCDFTKAGTTGAVSAVYSAGSATPANNNNIFRNNNFYDVVNLGASSIILQLASNTTNNQIKSNSFYETASRSIATALTFQMIRVSAVSVTGTLIQDNFIGGTAAEVGGSAMTITNTTTAINTRFFGIYNAGGSAAYPTSIQNNVIRNISFESADYTAAGGYFSGIINEGATSYANIGSVTGNTIGSVSAARSIVLTPKTSYTLYAYGIYVTAGTTLNIQNNNIGGISVEGGNTINQSFIGISDAATAGTHLISGNFIGSATIANSIRSAANTGTFMEEIIGIRKSGAGALLTIQNNTIANLTSAATSSSGGKRVNGIAVTGSGNSTISGNTMYNLSSASNTATNGANALLTGISISGGSVYTVSGNNMYNISGTDASAAIHAYGIYFTGNTTASTIDKNFIGNITLATSSTSAQISGIYISAGYANFSNNIISLGSGVTTGLNLHGIYDAGTTNPSGRNYYFNTVYLAGTVAGGSNTGAMWLTNATPTGRNIRNNIFYNGRTNSAGTAKHYALFVTGAPATTTYNYNNYYTPGSGGVFASYNSADVTVLPIVSGQDANSSLINPALINAGTLVAADYKPTASVSGITGTGITVDYENTARTASPTMGALESPNLWQGTTSADFSNTANWSRGLIPGTGESVIFAASPVNNCQLDQDRTVGNISLASGNKNIILGNYTLTATSVSQYSATQYIQTDGTGKLKLNVPSGTAVLFPVGRSVYNPVTITNNTGSADYFSAGVLDEVYRNGASGPLVVDLRIKKIWNIDKATANGGSGIDFAFQWNPADNHGLTTPALYHYEGSWIKQTAGVSGSPTSTSFSYTGYTGTFSPFAIIDINATLPLTWKSFDVVRKDKSVELVWETAAEQHTKDFTVQHSVNSSNWTNIGVVNAAGNSDMASRYSFLHTSPVSGDNYYRILQTDLDGKASYSGVKMIRFTAASADGLTLVNPVTNGILTVKLQENKSLSLVNMTGKTVWVNRLAAGSHSINVSGLAKGMYVLKTGEASVKIIIAGKKGIKKCN